MTVPTVTGTLRTRPAVGASTAPSASCCSTTERSATRARSALVATLSAVRASSSRVRGMVPRANRSSARLQIGLRLRELRLEAGDLRIERFHLQRDLFVADRRDDLTALDVVAFLDGELRHGAADARTGRNDIGAFDGGEHGLLVGDARRRDDEGSAAAACWASSASSRAATIAGQHWTPLQSSHCTSCAHGARAIIDVAQMSAARAPAAPPRHRTLRRRAAIAAIERADEFARRRAADRVPDGLAVAPRGDEPVLAQQRQVLRHGRIADAAAVRRARRPSAPSRSAGRR